MEGSRELPRVSVESQHIAVVVEAAEDHRAHGWAAVCAHGRQLRQQDSISPRTTVHARAHATEQQVKARPAQEALASAFLRDTKGSRHLHKGGVLEMLICVQRLCQRFAPRRGHTAQRRRQSYALSGSLAGAMAFPGVCSTPTSNAASMLADTEQKQRCGTGGRRSDG